MKNAIKRMCEDLADIEQDLPDAEDRTGDAEVDITVDMLGLVGEDVKSETVAAWTDAMRAEVQRWCAACHLDASDNVGIKIPPKPTFLHDEAAAEIEFYATVDVFSFTDGKDVGYHVGHPADERSRSAFHYDSFGGGGPAWVLSCEETRETEDEAVRWVAAGVRR